MCCAAKKDDDYPDGIWQSIREKLHDKGIDIDAMCSREGGAVRAKMVCIAPDLRESVEKMGETARDQTVMVRIDEATSKTLDEWVQTGYVKSRSEAAALFIREGLNVRATELDRMRDLIDQVEHAKERLREKAKEIFGKESPST